MKYTELLVNSFYSSSHTGTISGADIVNKVVNKETGDAAKLFLIIEDGKVKDAKFQACGSVVLFASLSAIMDIIIGNTLEEALKITEKSVIKEIKQVNRCDYSMVSFAVKALNVTLTNYLKKLERGTINKSSKPARIKNIKTANQINVYAKTKDDSEFENAYANMLEEAVEEKTEVKKEQNIEEKKVEIVKNDIDIVEPEIDIEEDLTPVIISPNKTEVIESVPTKIEVRILDEEELKPEPKMEITLTETVTKKTVSVKNEKASQDYIATEVESDKSDDVIDEIDSITAKLTDAITKLNFKFDVEDE